MLLLFLLKLTNIFLDLTLLQGEVLDLVMILISDLVDMVNSFDDMPSNKFLILLSHHGKRCLYLPDHPLEFGIDLAYLNTHPL